jgi:hypothetical protein
MEVLHGSVGWVASKSEKMLFQKKRQAEQKMQAHRLKSVFETDQEDEAFKTMIGSLITEDEEVNEEGIDVMEIIGNIDISPEQLAFFEDALIGGIDGLTAYYAAECRQGLMASVTGAFRLAENTDLLNPSQLMKM